MGHWARLQSSCDTNTLRLKRPDKQNEEPVNNHKTKTIQRHEEDIAIQLDNLTTGNLEAEPWRR